MSTEYKLLLPFKEVTAEESTFHVLKPTKKTWVFASLSLLLSYLAWFLIIIFMKYPDYKLSKSDYRFQIILILSISILSPTTSIFLWKGISKWITRRIVYETLKIHHEEDEGIKELFSKLREKEHYEKFSFFRALSASFFSIDIDRNTTYYLEEETNDLDISKLGKFFKQRLYDMITSSLGIGFLIASIVKYSIKSTYTGFVAGAIIILLTPLLISWLTPVIWIIKDSRIRFVKSGNNLFDLYERFRTSFLNRFFSISAWLAGLGFSIDLIQLLTGEYAPSFKTSIVMYLVAFVAVVIVAILMTGTLFIVGMVYLTKFHEENVNELREKLSEFLKYSQTNAIISKYYFM